MSHPIENLIRENIKKLVPYSSARSEYKQKTGIFLDANENPYGKHNRYPDPMQVELKKKLAEVKGVQTDQIFLANGSDGIVDIAYRIFCEPGQDKALNFPPSFGMYTVAAHLNNIELISIPLNEEFQINRSELDKYIGEENLKLIFLCSPNNPTGNHMKTEDIDYILNNFNGIVVIDEAYIDFNDRASYIEKLDQYPGLVVLQTLSKSWALAGARVGMAIMNANLVTYFNKIKTPYNISSIDQQVAMEALSHPEVFEENLKNILSEKAKLQKVLKNSSLIKKVYPSDTNFFLVEAHNGNELYQNLIKHQIVVRNQDRVAKNCLRITVGKPEENQALFDALKKIEA